MKVLTFWVEGTPVPKGRPRTFFVKGRTKPVTTTPPRSRAWEAAVRLFAQAACSASGWRPEPGRYALGLTVHRSRKAGDADNYAKSIGDALNGVVYPDDRSVMELRVTLVDDDKAGVFVSVTKELT